MTLAELMNMQGRVVAITGGMGHIGLTMAETLAELGADIVLVDRPGSDFSSRTSEIGQRWGVAVRGIGCDLERQEDRDRLVDELSSGAKRLDVLINNAAFVGTSDLKGWVVPLEEQSVETWRRAFEVNLTSAFDLTKRLLPLLRKSPAASIVNVSSIYGHFGPDWSIYEGTQMANAAAYGASKAGLLQLTRWMATTLAPSIRVNSISPGGVERGQPDVFRKRYEARTPLGRMATEDDFRGIIAYLASDMSCYVTGQDLLVDGGWSVW
jgi:NAD(P)-dependent dehydrogenase (short-subunit alcohol dehydrogenase family)